MTYYVIHVKHIVYKNFLQNYTTAPKFQQVTFFYVICNLYKEINQAISTTTNKASAGLGNTLKLELKTETIKYLGRECYKRRPFDHLSHCPALMQSHFYKSKREPEKKREGDGVRQMSVRF